MLARVNALSQMLAVRIFSGLIASGCAIILAYAIWDIGPSTEFEADSSQITHLEGHMFVLHGFPIKDSYWRTVSDNMQGIFASSLKLQENGTLLGPAHVPVADIIAFGMGRYSHWGDEHSQSVVFSTSDNTDPRTNGRRYAVHIVSTPLKSITTVALPLFLFTTWLALRGRGTRLMIVGASLLIVISTASWIFLLSGTALIQLDSSTYINAMPLVPIGYPLFIQAVSSILDYTSIGIVQIIIFTIASAYASIAIRRCTGSNLTAILSFLLLSMYSEIYYYAGHILSEALYTSLLVFCAGAGIHLLNRFSKLHAAILGVAAVGACAVRPAGYFVFAAMIYISVLLVRKTSVRNIAIFLWVPAILALLSVLGGNYYMRSSNSASQVGRVIFPHVAFLFNASEIEGPNRRFADAVALAWRPYQDEFAAQATWEDRFAFSARNYNPRLLAADQAVDRILDSGGVAATDRFRRLDEAMKEMALATIASKPKQYFELVIGQTIWAWKTHMLRPKAGQMAGIAAIKSADDYRQERDQIKSFSLPIDVEDVKLDKISSLPGFIVTTVEKTSSLIGYHQWIVHLTGVITFIAIVSAIFSKQNLLGALGFVGVLIHGAMILTTATTVFIPRYAVPIDPLLLLGFVLSISFISLWIKKNAQAEESSLT